jgi:hypothetical protein
MNGHFGGHDKEYTFSNNNASRLVGRSYPVTPIIAMSTSLITRVYYTIQGREIVTDAFPMILIPHRGPHPGIPSASSILALFSRVATGTGSYQDNQHICIVAIAVHLSKSH